MATDLPSPSNLGRIAACVASEALPHVESTSEAASRGTVIHAYLAACNEVGPDAALARFPPEQQDMLSRVPIEQLRQLIDPRAFAAEVSFALDVRTGKARELGRNIGREETRRRCEPSEMPGTADLVGLAGDGAVVGDFKTGHGEVDPAETNLQLKTYMLAAARAYGCSSARGSIIRVLDDGTVWSDKVEMDSLDLDAHEADLRELLLRRSAILAPDGDRPPPLREGPWCTYCPAYAHCPAKMNLAFATIGRDPQDLIAAVNPQTLTPEQFVQVWRRIEATEKLLERLHKAMVGLARQHPVETVDGTVIGAHQVETEKLIPDRLQPALAQLYGDQLAAMVRNHVVRQEPDATFERLREGLRSFVLPTIAADRARITALERDTRAHLRQAGAIAVSVHTRVNERKLPKEPPKAKGKKPPAPPPPAQLPASSPKGLSPEEAALVAGKTEVPGIFGSLDPRALAGFLENDRDFLGAGVADEILAEIRAQAGGAPEAAAAPARLPPASELEPGEAFNLMTPDERIAAGLGKGGPSIEELQRRKAGAA